MKRKTPLPFFARHFRAKRNNSNEWLKIQNSNQFKKYKLAHAAFQKLSVKANTPFGEQSRSIKTKSIAYAQKDSNDCGSDKKPRVETVQKPTKTLEDFCIPEIERKCTSLKVVEDKLKEQTFIEKFWCFIAQFKARPNCPPASEWRKRKEMREAEAAAAKVGMKLVPLDPVKMLPLSGMQTMKAIEDCHQPITHEICCYKDVCKKDESCADMKQPEPKISEPCGFTEMSKEFNLADKMKDVNLMEKIKEPHHDIKIEPPSEIKQPQKFDIGHEKIYDDSEAVHCRVIDMEQNKIGDEIQKEQNAIADKINKEYKEEENREQILNKITCDYDARMASDIISKIKNLDLKKHQSLEGIRKEQPPRKKSLPSTVTCRPFDSNKLFEAEDELDKVFEQFTEEPKVSATDKDKENMVEYDSKPTEMPSDVMQEKPFSQLYENDDLDVQDSTKSNLKKSSKLVQEKTVYEKHESEDIEDLKEVSNDVLEPPSKTVQKKPFHKKYSGDKIQELKKPTQAKLKIPTRRVQEKPVYKYENDEVEDLEETPSKKIQEKRFKKYEDDEVEEFEEPRIDKPEKSSRNVQEKPAYEKYENEEIKQFEKPTKYKLEKDEVEQFEKPRKNILETSPKVAQEKPVHKKYKKDKIEQFEKPRKNKETSPKVVQEKPVHKKYKNDAVEQFEKPTKIKLDTSSKVVQEKPVYKKDEKDKVEKFEKLRKDKLETSSKLEREKPAVKKQESNEVEEFEEPPKDKFKMSKIRDEPVHKEYEYDEVEEIKEPSKNELETSSKLVRTKSFTQKPAKDVMKDISKKSDVNVVEKYKAKSIRSDYETDKNEVYRNVEEIDVDYEHKLKPYKEKSKPLSKSLQKRSETTINDDDYLDAETEKVECRTIEKMDTSEPISSNKIIDKPRSDDKIKKAIHKPTKYIKVIERPPRTKTSTPKIQKIVEPPCPSTTSIPKKSKVVQTPSSTKTQSPQKPKQARPTPSTKIEVTKRSTTVPPKSSKPPTSKSLPCIPRKKSTKPQVPITKSSPQIQQKKIQKKQTPPPKKEQIVKKTIPKLKASPLPQRKVFVRKVMPKSKPAPKVKVYPKPKPLPKSKICPKPKPLPKSKVCSKLKPAPAPKRRPAFKKPLSKPKAPPCKRSPSQKSFEVCSKSSAISQDGPSTSKRKPSATSQNIPCSSKDKPSVTSYDVPCSSKDKPSVTSHDVPCSSKKKPSVGSLKSVRKICKRKTGIALRSGRTHRVLKHEEDALPCACPKLAKECIECCESINKPLKEDYCECGQYIITKPGSQDKLKHGSKKGKK